MLAALAAASMIQATPVHNTLTAQEKKDGWKLLFDGKSTKGWRNFGATTIGKGWVVKDGVLKSVDPNTAGDIVTTDKYGWFELSVEFNMEKGQNSGIMYHVADGGEAAWHSAPEIQIYDHPFQAGVQTTGFLYELYTAPKDAAKPAGQWNHFRIVVSKQKCETYVNGVKYYEYVLGSADWNARVAKSKFGEMPNFAKARTGAIGIQGDHGVVSFRNIKIKTLK